MKLKSSRIRIVDGQPRIHSGPEAQRRAAGPEQSQALTDRLNRAIRNRRRYAEETIVFFLCAMAGMACCLLGAWLFFGGGQ